MDLVANNNLGLSKAFGVEEFDAIISKAVKENSRENKFIKKTSFAPSGIGYGSGTCPRYWYYAFNGAEFVYDNTAKSIANMDAGTAAGQRIAKMLDNAGILEADETEARLEDPPVFGYIDAEVKWKGETIVCEVKTTKQETWNYRATQMKPPGYQLIQLLLYMHIRNVERGFFLIENKNTHEILILPIRMNDEYRALVQNVLEWMRQIKANADEGELPTRPFTKSSIPCKGCPVKDTCWKDFKRGSVNGHDPAPGTVTIEPLAIPK